MVSSYISISIYLVSRLPISISLFIFFLKFLISFLLLCLKVCRKLSTLHLSLSSLLLLFFSKNTSYCLLFFRVFFRHKSHHFHAHCYYYLISHVHSSKSFKLPQVLRVLTLMCKLCTSRFIMFLPFSIVLFLSRLLFEISPHSSRAI